MLAQIATSFIYECARHLHRICAADCCHIRPTGLLEAVASWEQHCCVDEARYHAISSQNKPRFREPSIENYAELGSALHETAVTAILAQLIDFLPPSWR